MIVDVFTNYIAMGFLGLCVAGISVIVALMFEELRALLSLLIVASVVLLVYSNIQATEIEETFDYTQVFEYAPGDRMEWGGIYEGVLYDRVMFEYNDKTIFISIGTNTVKNIGWKHFEILKVQGDCITIIYSKERII